MANFIVIRDLCEKNKITIRELASRVGLKEGAIQKIIQNGSTNTNTLEKIAKIFNVPAGYFFDEPEKDKSVTKKDNSNVLSFGENATIQTGKKPCGSVTYNNPDYKDIIKGKDEYIERIIKESYSRDKGKDDEIRDLLIDLRKERELNMKLVEQNMELVKMSKK